MIKRYKVLLLIAGFIWMAILSGLWFAIPVFAAMFADFGSRLPGPTQAMIDLGAFVRRHEVVAPLLALGVVLLGAEFERRNSVAGAWSFLAAAILVALAGIVALLLPILQLAAVSTGA